MRGTRILRSGVDCSSHSIVNSAEPVAVCVTPASDAERYGRYVPAVVEVLTLKCSLTRALLPGAILTFAVMCASVRLMSVDGLSVTTSGPLAVTLPVLVTVTMIEPVFPTGIVAGRTAPCAMLRVTFAAASANGRAVAVVRVLPLGSITSITA